jgi:hypothetical protein
MSKNLSLVLATSALLCCSCSCDPQDILTSTAELLNSEPDQHYYRVGKTHRNVMPFVWSNQSSVVDPNGNRAISHVYSTDSRLDSTRVTSEVVEISRYVTDSLSELGQVDNCSDESLINVYFVPEDTINDPQTMVFLTDPAMTNHRTLFGLTTLSFPFPISSSYICSDCEEFTREEIIVHELTHAWLSLCGHGDQMFSEELPEMLEAAYVQRLP